MSETVSKSNLRIHLLLNTRFAIFFVAFVTGIGQWKLNYVTSSPLFRLSPNLCNLHGNPTQKKKNVNFQLVVVTTNNEILEIIREYAIRSTEKHSLSSWSEKRKRKLWLHLLSDNTFTISCKVSSNLMIGNLILLQLFIRLYFLFTSFCFFAVK